jgi:hypothetical protein
MTLTNRHDEAVKSLPVRETKSDGRTAFEGGFVRNQDDERIATRVLAVSYGPHEFTFFCVYPERDDESRKTVDRLLKSIAFAPVDSQDFLFSPPPGWKDVREQLADDEIVCAYMDPTDKAVVWLYHYAGQIPLEQVIPKVETTIPQRFPFIEQRVFSEESTLGGVPAVVCIYDGKRDGESTRTIAVFVSCSSGIYLALGAYKQEDEEEFGSAVRQAVLGLRTTK